MAITKLRKAGLAVALVAGVSIAAAGTASAGTVTWNGVNGLDSIVDCEPGQDPYLHWILTPGGNSNITGATLYVNGTPYAGYKPGGGGGAWHFLTPSDIDLETATVYASYTGTAGANALVTISDGCTGEEPPS